MIVDKESRLQRKNISIVWETQENLLVKEGLSPEEQLCVTYIPFAANNAKVKLASLNPAKDEQDKKTKSEVY